MTSEKEPKEQQGSSADNKNRRILIVGIIAIILTIIIVGAVICMILLNSKDKGMDLDTSGLIRLEEEDDVEKVTPGYYEVSMDTTWNFEDGSSVAEAYVANGYSNLNPVYFEVTLIDTDEVVMTSPIMPVGTRLKEIRLDKPLDKGIYNALCTYYLVDEEGNELTNLSVTLTLNVLN